MGQDSSWAAAPDVEGQWQMCGRGQQRGAFHRRGGAGAQEAWREGDRERGLEVAEAARERPRTRGMSSSLAPEGVWGRVPPILRQGRA